MRKTTTVISILLLAAPLAAAQRPGGAGQRRPQGQGQAQNQGAQAKGIQQQDRDRIQATSRQRDEIRACDKSADRVAKQAREMAKQSGSRFNAQQAKAQQSRIQDQIRVMHQEHDRLMQGLSGEQRQALQEQIRNMNQIQERLNSRQQEMAQELGKPSPEAKRVAEHARETEQAMKEWRKQYGAMLSRLDIQP